MATSSPWRLDRGAGRGQEGGRAGEARGMSLVSVSGLARMGVRMTGAARASPRPVTVLLRSVYLSHSLTLSLSHSLSVGESVRVCVCVRVCACVCVCVSVSVHIFLNDLYPGTEIK